MGNLIFNGISTVNMGVQIQAPPIYEFPNKEYEMIHIEGKNGELALDKKSFKNVRRRYTLTIGFGQNETFITNAKMIANWLLSSNGYSRLEDSYEPDYYRMALFDNPGELPNMYDRATGIEVSFNCKPQRYLKTGETINSLIVLDTFIKIINPTNYISLPEIKIHGTNLAVDVVSGEDPENPEKSSSFIISCTDQFIIDSELQECYTETQYVNDQITLTNGLPKLYPGTNWIKISGIDAVLSKFEIKPRWWTL